MQDLIDKAIEAVKALPEFAQVRIGQSMLDAAERHRQLNAGFAEAEAELDGGMGIPAEAVVAELKRRYGA